MRKTLFLLAGFIQGCGSTAPITPATSTHAETSLQGSIGKKPFVARAAVVTDVNTTRQLSGPCSESELEEAKESSEWFKNHPEAWSTCSSTRNGPKVLGSRIYILERAVTCDDVRRSRPITQNEHAIEIELTGVWPPPPNTKLRSNAEDQQRTSDHVEASFADYRPSDGNGGYHAFGTVTFVQSSMNEGLLVVDLADDSGEATVRGSVRVKLCTPPDGVR